MDGVFQNLGYAVRQLRKKPGFTGVVVLTLTLGIGANTSVFSVMNAVLLRLLPVRDPARLYYVHIGGGQTQPPHAGNTGNSNTSFSEPVFEALRQRRDVLEDLVAYVPLGLGKVAVRYGDTPEEAEGDEVSGNFFSGLTAQIVQGRAFSLEDEQLHSPVVVISYDYWTRRFARNPSVLGQTLVVRNVPFTIIGIVAPGFHGIEPAKSTDFWVPLQNRPELNAWGIPQDVHTLYGTPKWWCMLLLARLRRNVTPEQAQKALESPFGEAAKIGIGTIDPKQWKPLVEFIPAKGIEGYNQQYRHPVQILMGLVFLVLLMASTNVALLLVARNEARRREFSLKIAIGAGRMPIFGQLFSESLLLVIAGAGLGWAFAVAATRALASWSGIETNLSPDHKVLLFTLVVSVISALAFGLAPLWVALRAPVSDVLRATAKGLAHGRHYGLGSKVMMSGQVAICLLLLIAAGLLLRTLRNYEDQDLGMNTDRLLVFGVTPQQAHTTADTLAFYRTLLERIRQLPGVEGATVMENRPGSGWSNNNDDGLDGMSLLAKFGPSGIIKSNDVGPEYFHILGIPLVAGRDISEADTLSSPPVAIVNETFVKRFLPDTNPLGHKIHKDRTIVGVAKDSKYLAADDPPTPSAYYASFQNVNAGKSIHFAVKTHGEPLGLLPEIGKVSREIDPTVPLEAPMTLEAQFELSYSEPKLFARLGAFFGGLAALLVATGLYGTLSYRTNRRTTEIGTRIALGARRTQVLWIILRESFLITAVGATLGLPLALLGVRLLSSMLYQLSPFDRLSFIGAFLAIALVAAVAGFLPAWRAAKLEPMVALRYE